MEGAGEPVPQGWRFQSSPEAELSPRSASLVTW